MGSLALNDGISFACGNIILGGYSDGKEDGLLQIEDDGVIPPIIDLRICNPGAAKGFASAGSMMPYTPPSYAPVQMRIAPAVLEFNAYEFQWK